jgi:hypothetical protein
LSPVPTPLNGAFESYTHPSGYASSFFCPTPMTLICVRVRGFRFGLRVSGFRLQVSSSGFQVSG